MKIPDNFDMWEANEARLEKLLERLPECENCGCKIDDDFYFDINDAIFCEDCLNIHHRKRVEDFIA